MLRLLLRFYFILSAFLLFSAEKTFSQQEGNIWYFGDKAGINFNGNTTALPDGVMSTNEGCASISNSAGNFQFYTDGVRVWNRQHNVMPNGVGLLGDSSSTHSAVIIPKPGSLTMYYIFTVDDKGGAEGLRYSEVNMSLDGGKGSVTSKNTMMLNSVTEKITAIRHQNGTDFWLIAHNWNSSSFASFLVNSSGVAPFPILSTVGTPHNGPTENSEGCFKSSVTGKRLALAIKGRNIVELFSFNPGTGSVNSAQTFDLTVTGSIQPYGVEFSSDENKLYVSMQSPAKILQLNLLHGVANDILANRYVLGTPGRIPGSLQLAPDGKIYCALLNSNYLGVIEYPNRLNNASNYTENGFYLSGKQSRLGLPTIIQSYFVLSGNFTFSGICTNDTIKFIGTASVKPEFWFWNFNDPASGIYNESDTSRPYHIFKTAGTYQVRMVIGRNDLWDTIIKPVFIQGRPAIDLPDDTTLCDGAEYIINPGLGAINYRWSDNSTGSTFKVTGSGKYWVEVSDGSCPSADTMKFTFLPVPDIELGPDQSHCEGVIVTLDAGDGESYLWSTGVGTKTIKVSNAGKYYVTVTNDICKKTDSVNIAYKPIPEIELPNDTSLCANTLSVEAKVTPGAKTIWSHGPQTNKIEVSESGKYILTIEKNSCFAKDSINISMQPYPIVELGDAGIVCDVEKRFDTLDAGEHTSYEWSTGEIGRSIVVYEPGTYQVKVSTEHGCSAYDTITVQRQCESYFHMPTSFTPNSDQVNDVLGPVTDNIHEYKLIIFNRYGQIIFETTDPHAPWDGSFKEKSCEGGEYGWFATYLDMNNRKFKKYGFIFLVR